MIDIKLADDSDSDFFFEIKGNKDNMYWAGHIEKPDYDKLKVFFDEIIANQSNILKRKIYTIWAENRRCGYLYLDPIDLNTASISIAVMDNYSGKGYGKTSLIKMMQIAYEQGYRKLIAEIREDNIRSKRLFTAVGFNEDNIFRPAKINNINKNVNMFQYSIHLRGITDGTWQ